MPDQEMNKMGFQAFDEMKRTLPKDNDPALNQYVRCVSQAVAREADVGVSNWEVVVFKDESANAFALPGGKIGVHTGILKVAVTPAQLAAVLGHEVGHVIARHGNEKISEALLAQSGLVLAGALSKEGPTRNLILGALGVGTQFGVLLPHGRRQESEADEIGLMLMARAGFDPRESVDLWKNMSKQTGHGPPEFLSTHPSHSTRIEQLQAKMDSALQVYEKSRSMGKVPACKR